ncbi:MAG: choice-of-anchor L domain-containing protein [Polyangiaceae bacterium]|jgi:hypothetical protein|nr:choice-of-anchor L domain-containing protein [Polyangiaceae bacterium]
MPYLPRSTRRSTRHSALSLIALCALISACSGAESTSDNPQGQGGSSGAAGSSLGGSAGSSLGGAAGTAGAAGSTAGSSGAGAGGDAGSSAGGSAGDAGAGGDAGAAGDAGAGGSDPAGAGGSDPAGAGGSDPAGAGGSDPAGAGGSDPAGAGGDAGSGGDSGSSGQAGDGGAAGDAGAGGGASCPEGQALCGEQCVAVLEDPLNCGACNVLCNSANGQASCLNGLCDITCSDGFTKCGNSCVDLQADPLNCGACDAKCSTNNGAASCASGACQIQCADGFADCDSNLANGCEVQGSCACTPGQQEDCYDGPAGTKDVGLCKGGKKTCNAGGTGYSACEGQVLPATETCAEGNVVDEDCDGQANEGGDDPSCVCTPGQQVSCYDGPFGTAGVGLCKVGTKTCNASGTGYGACEGQILPAAETCAAGALNDEDCDGQVNEGGAGCTCVPGSFQPCYDNGLNSPQLQAPNGICATGLSECNADGIGYGICQGQNLPQVEICDAAGIDEDCDGQVNEGGAGCECVPGASEACWTGPGNAVFGGTSVCKKGSRTCQASGKWGSCVGQVLPGVEPIGVCTANIDEDCDGNAPGPGGQDLDGDGWTACGGDCCETKEQCSDPKLVNPGAFDVGGNNLDDDCDGTKDNAVASCDGGLASNSNNALDYARAMDLCQTTTENDPLKKWGVISAQLTLANGAGVPNVNSRAIRPGFGTQVAPKKGNNLAVLSTGGAADLNDVNPGYLDFQTGAIMGTSSGFPADWLAANGGQLPNAPGCPGLAAGATANDPVMLRLRIRVPTNAQSFSFNSFFYSSEFPEWVCTPYNDFFVALLDSSFSGQPANPADKNLAFYDPPPAGAPFFPVGVNLARLNNGLFQVCLNGQIGCAGSNPTNISTCTQGTGQLAGTGMDILEGGCGANNTTGGGTGYLTSSGNVRPGEIIEMRFAVWDTGDSIYDSLVLLDNWTWSLNASQPGTVISQ